MKLNEDLGEITPSRSSSFSSSPNPKENLFFFPSPQREAHPLPLDSSPKSLLFRSIAVVVSNKMPDCNNNANYNAE